MDTRPTILIAEDDELTRVFLHATLNKLGYQVIGWASDGVQTVEKALALKPGALLLDIGMPVLDGLEAARRILAERLMPIVVLTGIPDEEILEKARSLGVQAFLMKPLASKEQLRAAISIAVAVCERQRRDSAQIDRLNSSLESARIKKVPASLGSYGLTRRETEILHLVSQGRANIDISAELDLSPRTVEKHVEHILEKIGVKSRTAAARLVADAERGQELPH
jgi:response regulator NasT